MLGKRTNADFFREIIVNTVLFVLWASFAQLNLDAFFNTGRPVFLIFVLMQSTVMALFLLRRAPLTKSRARGDWLYAVLGTAVPMFFEPFYATSYYNVGNLLIIIAACTALLSYFSLGRSFGIVAANRGVAVGGLYRAIRHPIYASYLLLALGYLILNPSAQNSIIAVLDIFFVIMRIRAEERHLLLDEEYRLYTKMVPWRLIPFVY